jgi:hypothetical protein
MMRLGHYRPVHVKSPAAQSMRTTFAARMQLVTSQLQIEGTIRGLLKVYGLKIGAIHRNRLLPVCSSCSKWPHCRNCRQQSSRCCGFERAYARKEKRLIAQIAESAEADWLSKRDSNLDWRSPTSSQGFHDFRIISIRPVPKQKGGTTGCARSSTDVSERVRS